MSNFWWIFGSWEDWTIKFLLSASFCKLGWKSKLCASKLRYFWKFRKSENETKNCHSESVKISALSKKISAEQRFQRGFLILKNFVISAVQSWISALQQFSGNEQRWIRNETFLNQNQLALNVSKTSTWGGIAVLYLKNWLRDMRDSCIKLDVISFTKIGDLSSFSAMKVVIDSCSDHVRIDGAFFC